jgi:hypothetical protein
MDERASSYGVCGNPLLLGELMDCTWIDIPVQKARANTDRAVALDHLADVRFDLKFHAATKT